MKHTIDEPEDTEEPEPAEEPEATDEPEATVEPEPADEPEPLLAADHVTGPDPVLVLEPEDAEDDTFLHPIEPLHPLKIPSEQKLEELFHITHPVMATLLNKLTFFGMMDLQQISAYTPTVPPDSLQQTLNMLVSRGYLAGYDIDGRVLYCFTPQTDACFRKPALAATIRYMLHKDKLPMPSFVADDEVPRDDFMQRLQQVDMLQAFLSDLRTNPTALGLLPSSFINEQLEIFLLLTLPGQNGVSLVFLPASELATAPLPEKMGAICHSDALPDMEGVGDEMHFCFTAHKLYQWKNGSWVCLTP